MTMTKILLVIADGRVTNAIVVPADAEIAPDGLRAEWPGDGIDAPYGSQFIAAPEGVGIDWTIDNEEWVPPPPDGHDGQL